MTVFDFLGYSACIIAVKNNYIVVIGNLKHALGCAMTVAFSELSDSCQHKAILLPKTCNKWTLQEPFTFESSAETPLSLSAMSFSRLVDYSRLMH